MFSESVPNSSNINSLFESRLLVGFGEVPVPPWFKIAVALHKDSSQSLFQVEILIKEHTHAIYLGLHQENRSTPGEDYVFRRHAQRRWVYENFLWPQQRMNEVCFVQLFDEALWVLRSRLYELDPRIGWRANSSFEELPTSRLLDAPFPFSKTGLPPRHVGSAQEGVRHTIEPRCSFCERLHTEEDPPMWAGANLLWVHQGCWVPPKSIDFSDE